MSEPEIKPFAGFYSYNTFEPKPAVSDNLVLIGAKANLSKGTSLSLAVGSFMKTGEKPLLEVKAVQNLSNMGNVNFKAQARGRFKTDGYKQLRGAVTAGYQMKNNVTPYVAAHLTHKNGSTTAGSWIGVNYNNASVELQYDRGLQTNKSSIMANFIINI